MNTVIEYKGHMFFFQKPRNLTETQFQDRCWFIVKNSDHSNVEAYADIWISQQYYNVTYTREVMEKIRILEQNMISTC
jgi:hypothetical protein